MAANNVKVGLFLIGGLVLFAVGLFMIGSRNQLFAHHFEVYAEFEKVDTLQPGARVRVSGMDAGEMTDIRVPNGPSARFRLKLKVEEKFHAIVRDDSVVTIESEGMVGNKYLNIKKGSAQYRECPEGGTLPTQEPVELSDLMRQGSGLVSTTQSTIADLKRHADTAIANIANLAGHADGIVVSVRRDVKKMTSNGAHMTDNANQIVAGVRQGHGVAGELLTDSSVSSNVAAAVANAKQASTNVQQASRQVDTIVSDVRNQDMPDVEKALENTGKMTGQLNQALGTFLSQGNHNQNTAEALRDTVQEARQTTINLAADTEALKHNFFLRGFFKRRGYFNLRNITPNKYAETEFVKRSTARVWVVSPGLFEAGPDGKQKLAKDGPAILDQSMSELVPYLPHNPMVVEGYSEGGPPEKRYLSSEQRAMEVRQYLISRFHLEPTQVGIMPLGEQPPPGVHKQMWDGVCLVVVASKK